MPPQPPSLDTPMRPIPVSYKDKLYVVLEHLLQKEALFKQFNTLYYIYNQF